MTVWHGGQEQRPYSSTQEAATFRRSTPSGARIPCRLRCWRVSLSWLSHLSMGRRGLFLVYPGRADPVVRRIVGGELHEALVRACHDVQVVDVVAGGCDAGPAVAVGHGGQHRRRGPRTTGRRGPGSWASRRRLHDMRCFGLERCRYLNVHCQNVDIVAIKEHAWALPLHRGSP